MKKIKNRFALLFALVLTIVLCCPALAVGEYGQLELVTDQAGLLTEDERASLQLRAEEITEQYECAVYVVTVDTMDGMSAADFTQKLHSENDLGYGEDKSSVMFMISMEDRDYDLMAYGYGNTAFTDYGKEQMTDAIVPDLSDGDYNAAFTTYLDMSADYLSQARDGTPYDVGSETSEPMGLGSALVVGIPGSLLIGAIVALIVCSIFKSQMKTAVEQDRADDYLDQKNIKISHREDRFLNTTVTRIKKPKDDDHGGTTVNDSGYSHDSGKF